MTPLLALSLGAYRFLTLENGLLHRATSLTYKGLRDAFVLCLSNVQVTANPFAQQAAVLAEVQKRGLQFPFGEDSLDFLRVVQDFVTSYVHVYYKSDAEVRADHDFEATWRAINAMGLTTQVKVQHLHSIEPWAAEALAQLFFGARCGAMSHARS